MNREFHNQRQSLVVTDKQASVGNLFDLSKKLYWSHVQYKFRRKCRYSFSKDLVSFLRVYFSCYIKAFFLISF